MQEMLVKMEEHMITSTSNVQIKEITALLKKSKERKEKKAFVIEGRKMFEEICQAQALPRSAAAGTQPKSTSHLRG